MNFYKNFREKYPSKPEQIFIHYSNFEFENWINFQTHVQHARFQTHSLFRKQEMVMVIKKFLFYFYNRKKKKKEIFLSRFNSLNKQGEREFFFIFKQQRQAHRFINSFSPPWASKRIANICEKRRKTKILSLPRWTRPSSPPVYPRERRYDKISLVE